MKTNIFISIIVVFLVTIAPVSAIEINYYDSSLDVGILSEIFDTFGGESIENLELMEEFLSEYETIESYTFENTLEFQELEEFIENSIFK